MDRTGRGGKNLRNKLKLDRRPYVLTQFGLGLPAASRPPRGNKTAARVRPRSDNGTTMGDNGEKKHQRDGEKKISRDDRSRRRSQQVADAVVALSRAPGRQGGFRSKRWMPAEIINGPTKRTIRYGVMHSFCRSVFGNIFHIAQRDWNVRNENTTEEKLTVKSSPRKNNKTAVEGSKTKEKRVFRAYTFELKTVRICLSLQLSGRQRSTIECPSFSIYHK